MFRKPLLISLSVLGALTLVLILVLFQTSDEDLVTYQTLSKPNPLADEASAHKRKIVTKNIWLANGQYLHLTALEGEYRDRPYLIALVALVATTHE